MDPFIQQIFVGQQLPDTLLCAWETSVGTPDQARGLGGLHGERQTTEHNKFKITCMLEGDKGYEKNWNVQQHKGFQECSGTGKGEE